MPAIESGTTNGSKPGQTTGKARSTKGGQTPANPKPAEPEKPEAAPDEKKFWAAVNEAKKLLTEIDDRWWRLGELADGVETVYGEKKLAKFANELKLSPCTVERHRDVFRAWRGNAAPGRESFPQSYSVARELQALDDRFDLIEANPNITKREASDLRLMRAGKPRRKKKQKGDWLGNNAESDFKHVHELANKIISATKIVDSEIKPDLEQELADVAEVGKAWLPTMRKASEQLIKFVNLCEILAGVACEEVTPETASKSKRASKAKSASKAEQPQATA
jgi:hypothetical protein